MKTKLLNAAILFLIIFVSPCSKKAGQKSEPAFNKITITGISPDYGKTGTEITITGANFAATAAANMITLGGKPVSEHLQRLPNERKGRRPMLSIYPESKQADLSLLLPFLNLKQFLRFGKVKGKLARRYGQV